MPPELSVWRHLTFGIATWTDAHTTDLCITGRY